MQLVVKVRTWLLSPLLLSIRDIIALTVNVAIEKHLMQTEPQFGLIRW